MIRNLRETVSFDVLRMLYFGLVQSVLQYGLIFWGSSSHFGKAFIAQKRILRTMFNVHPTTTCKDLFTRAKIMTLPSLYIYRLILYIRSNEHKFKKNEDIHSHDTRQKNNIHQNYSRLKVGQNSPDYVGIKMFNKFKLIYENDNNDKWCNASFETKLKKFLIHNAFYSIEQFFQF